MNTLTIDHKNGHSTTYQLIEDGHDLPIAYNINTSKKVIEVMERARKNRQRLKFYLGDTETGKDWGEEHDTIGYVGLSRGYEARFPILIYNERTSGGGHILDDCIVKIKEAKGNMVLYQAENYKPNTVEIVASDLPEYKYNINVNGETYSRHTTLRQAELLKARLS